MKWCLCELAFLICKRKIKPLIANSELSTANPILFERKSFTANKMFMLADEREMIGKYLPTLIITPSM
ncbi:MAG: hypothetical protein ACREAK_00315 [Nitrosarchaeum sp.]